MTSMLDIKGRVAVVTGASSGNGREIALTLADAGADVVCSDISPECKEGGYEETDTPTHELIVSRGGQAIYQKADVSSEEQVKALVETTVAKFGRLDIFVNNAGIFCGLANIVDEPVENFDKTMAVNTRGVFLGMKYAITQMMKQEPLPSGERGWVVNVASIGGQVGLLLEPSYCSSKGAVVQLTRQVAIDYAKEKIHVNAVCPGFLSTAMVRPFLEDPKTKDLLLSQSPWPHLGTAQDVGKAVLILSSNAASWMTGSFLQVDGGFIAK